MAAELDPDARDRLLDALVENPGNVSAAARASGYSRMHVYRLLKDKGFLDLLERRKAQAAAKPEEPSKPAGEKAGQHPDVEAARKFLRRAMAGKIDAEAKELAARISAAKALLAHHGLKVKATKPGPATAAPPAAVIKVLPGAQGVEDAAKWLEAQG